MLFVVVREIEQERQDFWVFTTETEAREYYKQAAYVCWDEPDHSPGGDPSIVTNCWLYEAATDNPETAKEAAAVGRAKLLAVCFAPEDGG
jgi:hypothetical protein